MSQLRILFVDDSDLDVMLAVKALRQAGYEVVQARVDRAADMETKLLSQNWDAVICDHSMPEFDALSALRLHKEVGEDVPFLILSGAMADDVAIAAMREGARDFVSKGQLSRLAPAIEREMREAKNRQLLRQTQASVDRLLHYDRLTGVGNIDALMQKLAAMTATATPLWLVLVDVHRFRRLTQSLGMVTANRILRVLAMRLDALPGEDGFTARVGIDRFAMLFKVGSMSADESVDQISERIRLALLPPFELGEQKYAVTAYLGAAGAPMHGKRADELLHAAEAALDAAKRVGPQHFVVFGAEAPVPAARAEVAPGDSDSAALERALYRAVSNGEFVLHYQPQVYLASGRPLAVEALLRWRCPERGLQTAADFVPMLEDSGLISLVGDWVIGEAAGQLRRWREMGLPRIGMTVNISAVQFQSPAFVGNLERLLREAGVAPSDIELDISESIALGNEELTIATLGELKGLGIRVALDDFGSGYSSLAYLQHFSLTRLKIDSAFVHGSSPSPASACPDMVRAIVALGEHLQLPTLAEGVETADQAAQMQAAGCHAAQGYFFGQPMPAEELEHYLRRWV
jgi:diguanylate cyclase